jgi:hypothetical protein
MFASGEAIAYDDLNRTNQDVFWNTTPVTPFTFNDAFVANRMYVMVGPGGISTHYDGIDGWTPRSVPGVSLTQDSVAGPGTGCGGSDANNELFIISDRYVFRTT